MKKIWQRKKTLIFLILAIIVFVGLIVGVKTNSFIEFDNMFYNQFYFNSDNTLIMKKITMLGDELVFIPLTVLFLVFLKDKKIGIFILINLILSSSLNAITKLLIQRPRPEGFALVSENGFSFPSGHSFTSFAFYGFLIFLIYKLFKNIKIKFLLISLLCCIILFVGLSRVYLGVHFITDVFGAYAYSYIYLYFFVKLFDKFKIISVRKIGKKQLRN